MSGCISPICCCSVLLLLLLFLFTEVKFLSEFLHVSSNVYFFQSAPLPPLDFCLSSAQLM